MTNQLTVVGGGLAGCEAAWQAAERGVQVHLYEMRPERTTPAHVTKYLAELVCSNSLGSTAPNRAPGLLKAELRGLGSLILDCANASAVPAGTSLSVDREEYARRVTEAIEGHPRITLVRREVTIIPAGPCIIASGPLTSVALAEALKELSGREYLYFYDAVSPIVTYESINMDVAFRASRHGRGSDDGGDYINCPLNEADYDLLQNALVSAQQIELREFEREDPSFFEGCLPLEVMAKRGRDALRYGPLRPIGLEDPRTGSRPYAVVQLRQDNLAGSLYNLVGFQTNLRWGEQRRVLRLIPGLEQAEFMRYGMMHRNTYINAPQMLQPTMQYRNRADLLFAGQIVGAEGYVGNAATGLVAGINAARLMTGEHPVIFPTNTMIGALCHYVCHAEPEGFQPMKANFGLLPKPESVMKRADRYEYYCRRALRSLRRFARSHRLPYDRTVAEDSMAITGEGHLAT